MALYIITNQLKCHINNFLVLSDVMLPPPLQVWSVSSGSCKVTLAHDSAVLSCDISPDSTRLITGDTEGSVKVGGRGSVCVCMGGQADL